MPRLLPCRGIAVAGLAMALLAGCGKNQGTYVLLRFEGNVSPGAAIATIVVGTTLAGQSDSATFTAPAAGSITLPTTAYLEIGAGEGRLDVHAVARSSDGTALAQGDGHGDVSRGATATLTVELSPLNGNLDAGAQADASTIDAQSVFDLARPEVPLAADAAGSDAALALDAAAPDLAADTSPSPDVRDALVDAGMDIPGAGGGLGGTSGSGGAAGRTGALVPSPSALTFTQTPVGTTSQPQTLSLSDQGSTALGPLHVTIQDPTLFLVDNDNCDGKTLQPGTSCSLAIAFKPASAKIQASNVSVSAPDLPRVEVPLTGYGVNAVSAVDLAPTFYDFGPVDIGGLGAAYMFTVRNTGNTTTVISDVGTVPPGPPYRLVDDRCMGKALLASETCVFTIQFLPILPGIYIASLNVGTNAGAGASISIKGTGK